MQRRDVLRMLVVGAAHSRSCRHVCWLIFTKPKHKSAASYTAAHAQSRQQNALVVTMIDLIIPVTDTPGAKAARVNEFIDVILTDWAHDDGAAGVSRRPRRGR